VLDQARLVVGGGDFPQLFDAQAVSLRIDAPPEIKARHQLLGQAATAALREESIGRAQFHAGLVVGAGVPALVEAHVAGRDADDAATFLQQFGGRKAGIDFDAQPFGLRGKPAHDVPEAHDVIAVIMHLRRGRQFEGARFGQEEEAVVLRLGLDRAIHVAPVGQKLVQGPRLDHGARQDMSTDLAALFDDADRCLGFELLEADRGGEPGGAGAHDQDIEFHRLALHDRSILTVSVP
jgi:hypothetical protein